MKPSDVCEKSEKNEFERSPCPIANVLDVFGDKWTLLIVRDLFLGKLRYGEFAESMEGIPSNSLANRLKRLEMAGVVIKTVYCHKPVRYQYELTEKGRDLLPVLDAMLHWARKHVPGVRVFPKVERVGGAGTRPVAEHGDVDKGV